MLDKVKLALRLTTCAYDNELTDLIDGAKADLGIVGIDNADTDPLIVRAIVTYCRLNFGSPDDYERLKMAYDEQKAQMISSSLYGLR